MGGVKLPKRLDLGAGLYAEYTFAKKRVGVWSVVMDSTNVLHLPGPGEVIGQVHEIIGAKRDNLGNPRWTFPSAGRTWPTRAQAAIELVCAEAKP